MISILKPIRVLILLAAGGCCWFSNMHWALGQQTSPDSLPALRLHYRSPNQHMLHVVGQGDAEVAEIQTASDKEGVVVQKIESLENLPLDCSAIHTIILGTNGVDFFGSEAEESRKNEVIKTLERFVAQGGHFICFGSFNGRNTERLNVFGLRTEHYHNAYFRSVPGRSEVFYSGLEHLVPNNGKLRSFGIFYIEEARKPVMMIQRGVVVDPANAEVESYPDASLLSTFIYKRGRVTYTASEPSAEGLWMIPMFVKWINRGAPTNMEQIGENPVVPHSRLRKYNTPEFSLSVEELQAAVEKFKEEIEVDAKSLRLSALKTSYAESLEKEALAEGISPALKFVLLREAAVLRLSLGDISLFSELAADLDNTFSNAASFLDEAIPNSAGLVGSPSAKRELIELLLSRAENTRLEHRYQSAMQMLTVAQELANTLGDTESIGKLSSIQQEILTIADAEGKVKNELVALNNQKLDAAGKTKIGMFYGYDCGDWELAFPLLVDGADEQLKAIAQLEQRDSKLVKERLELARFWEKQSRNLAIPAKHNVGLRARKWYLSVLPELRVTQYREVIEAIDALELPKATLNVRLNLDGAGRILIRPNEYRWEGHYGELNGSVQLNSKEWYASQQTILERTSADGLLPLTTQLDYPKLKRIKGRGQVTLNRTGANEIVIDLNDVPIGSDDYEFEIELVQ